MSKLIFALILAIIFSAPAVMAEDITEAFESAEGIPMQLVFREGEGYILRMSVEYLVSRQKGGAREKRRRAKRAVTDLLKLEVIRLATGENSGHVRCTVIIAGAWAEVRLSQVQVNEGLITPIQIRDYLERMKK